MEVEEIITKITKPDGAILIATDNNDNNNNAIVGCFEIYKRSADLARLPRL